MSKTKKWLIGLAATASLCILGILYLLHPSGQIAEFQQWQYQKNASANANSRLTVKFFGVSTLLFDDGRDQILIDGFF